MNPDFRLHGDARLDDLERKADTLLEFCGNLEGDLKELRRRIWATESMLREFDKVMLERYPG